MDLFRETLEAFFQKKRAELAALKSVKTEPVESETTPARLDYSVSKTLKAIEEFTAERQKRSRKAKAVKETDL